jgi:hypothetical protein
MPGPSPQKISSLYYKALETVGRAALLSQRGAVCGVKIFGPAAQVAGEGPFAETWLLHCSFPLTGERRAEKQSKQHHKKSKNNLILALFCPLPDPLSALSTCLIFLPAHCVQRVCAVSRLASSSSKHGQTPNGERRGAVRLHWYWCYGHEPRDAGDATASRVSVPVGL